MIYNDFHGKKISALGMGGMRFPHLEKYEDIDIKATEEMFAYAIEHGINYFDTAWGYHGGNSERVVGEILSAYKRDEFFLADKFPGYDLSNMDKVEEIFEKQLPKCRVDYFDFYLFHNVCEMNIEYYLNPKYRIYKYLKEQKKAGKIRHLGFSVHGNLETTKRFLEAFGDVIDFCQIQLNWLDYDFQDAKEKIKLLSSLSLPFWVMEPLRGGKLCNLSAVHREKLAALNKDRTETEWAFRFVQTMGAAVTLSGMSNLEQVKENIKYFENRAPLNEEEIKTLREIGKEITAKNSLNCTACRYCTKHCKKGLNIPRIIELYNEKVFSGGGFLVPNGIKALGKDKSPANCVGCRACEKVCPQNIKISEMMASFR